MADIGDVFVQRLRAKACLLGLLVKMPAQALIELSAYVGFDFVVIDTEHGSADHDQLEHHVRAADAVSMPTLIRVPSLEPGLIGRALDCGANGVIFPHISSPEAAERAVRVAHYPPRGDRGLATSTRAGRHGTISVERHLRRSANRTVVVAQIEDAEAVNHARAIADTPGLDCVWIGPNDLSLSMALPRAHPDVAQAERQIIDGVRESNGAALAVVANGAEDGSAWIAAGASVVIFASPPVLTAPLRAMVEAIRSTQAAEAGLATALVRGLDALE